MVSVYSKKLRFDYLDTLQIGHTEPQAFSCVEENHPSQKFHFRSNYKLKQSREVTQLPPLLSDVLRLLVRDWDLLKQKGKGSWG